MRSWLRRAFGSRPTGDSRRRWIRLAPALEPLGDRCLLSAGLVQANLISDVPGLAQFTDTGLSNPWGIAYSPTGAFWLSDNNTGASPVYRSQPAAPDLSVAIPRAASSTLGWGTPTGSVFNGGPGFSVSEGGASGPSLFLFATEDGLIAGWSPGVDMANAIVAVDNSATPGLGPVYTGLAIASNAQGNYLFAANFRTGSIDVFNQNFQPIHTTGAFTDPNIPNEYAPFNIQAIGASLYVTYTEKDGGRYDQGGGPGNGYVDVFDTNGTLVRRLASEGPLNSPWGVAQAPSSFGDFSNALLVGNFGDGHINAFDPQSGAYLGALTDTTGLPIVIPQLWSLTFGNDGSAGASDTLYFTAGIGHESHGVFGSLQLTSVSAGANASLGSFDALHTGGDAYPLPPSGGPTLRQTPLVTDGASVVLAPLQGNPTAVVPTLLANAEANTATSTSSPAAVSASQGATGAQATATPQSGAEFVMQNDTSTNVLMDLYASPRPAENTTAAASPVAYWQQGVITTSRWDLNTLPGGVLTPANMAVSHAAESTSGLIFNKEATTATEDNVVPPAPLNETQEAIGDSSNSSAKSRESESPKRNWWVQASYCLMLAFIGGYSLHYMRVNLRVPGKATLITIRSLLSRLTKLSDTTRAIKLKATPASNLASTRVIEVVPLDRR